MSKFSEQQVEKPSHERPASPPRPQAGGTVAGRAGKAPVDAETGGDAPGEPSDAVTQGDVAAPTGSPEANADKDAAEKR